MVAAPLGMHWMKSGPTGAGASEANSALSPRNALSATITLIVLLFALFIGVLAYSTLRAYDDAENRARDHADAASQVVAINSRWIVDLAQQALRRIDDSLGPNMLDIRGDTVRDLHEAVTALPGRVKAYVFNGEGATLYSTDLRSRETDITTREFFKAPAAGQLFYISPLIVRAEDGEQVFVFSRRIEREGRFAGVAVISFSMQVFEDIWRSLDLDPTSTVSLLRDDGQLVARYPFADGPLDLSKYVLFTDYLKQQDAGTYFAVSPADGVKRYVGFRKVEGTGLVALSSVSATSSLNAFWRNTILTFALALPAAIGLVVAAVWIVRLLMRDAARRDQLARALEINRLLFRDTHHRVKNNLQSVQSLVRMQSIPPDAKIDLQRRIAAMTAVHEHIYRADQYVEVQATEFIPAIVEPLLQSFDSRAEIAYDLDAVTVDRDHTTPLALLVNEVITNAMKYAFPDDRPARISVSLKAGEPTRALLTIRDNGIGFDQDHTKKGMGSRLIRGMVQQLGGTSSYRIDGGTVFEADISLRSGGAAVQPAEAGLVQDAAE